MSMGHLYESCFYKLLTVSLAWLQCHEDSYGCYFYLLCIIWINTEWRVKHSLFTDQNRLFNYSMRNENTKQKAFCVKLGDNWH